MAATEAVDALTAAFERIAATRMAGLPMNNPALKVAAVGFQPWAEDYLLGVLITPWAINLVVLGAGLRLAADRRLVGRVRRRHARRIGAEFERDQLEEGLAPGVV